MSDNESSSEHLEVNGAEVMPPDMHTIKEEVINKVFADIIEKYKKSCVALSLVLDNKLSPINSCVGGIPYFPKNMKYPQNDEGELMVLLAQINYSEMPHLDNFPQSGILQFFINPADDYGMESYKLIYHKDVDEKLQQKLPAKVDKIRKEALEESTVPFSAAFKLIGTISETVYINPDESDQVYEKLALKYSVDKNNLSFEMSCDDRMTKLLSHYGGNPSILQCDPREGENKKKTVPLLELDSVSYSKDEERAKESKDETFKICWGDVGIGMFFIEPDKLKNLDFSDTLYSYDSC
ncbi:hypothetical protein EIN_418860 [Entamoeba invadens IP1]|uniref:DUF1963 domain-containing protein n=1 Tax=Entamoeba invadens IP1 TaxID=370355 RepID=A0A0A1U543_ENTIV|nr:hypothetical protein EIN_418860 [Entamoeba invadens IP1]ELP87987.1 hypothetical protein EIN_418860 [Entamoeba invadens IP1]|eukprot:XP_004254758.1 hypothetical protein EIN_418860 [Entamoeba invadens IP1]